jgi:hypothetical protein
MEWPAILLEQKAFGEVMEQFLTCNKRVCVIKICLHLF